MLAMRAGQAHFLAGLGGHALQFQVKVKAFATLGALKMIHFPLPTLRVSGVPPEADQVSEKNTET